MTIHKCDICGGEPVPHCCFHSDYLKIELEYGKISIDVCSDCKNEIESNASEINQALIEAIQGKIFKKYGG